jgi:hypothetical protein
VQLDYGQYNAELQLGNIADTSLRQVESFSAEGVVGLAKAVIRGTNPERQVVQAGTGVGQGALIIGVSILSQSVEQLQNSGIVQYEDKTTVPVMVKGRIVVETFDAVVAGAVANFHLATGKWTDAAVGAGIEAAGIKAKFYRGNTAAGLAILEIDAYNA